MSDLSLHIPTDTHSAFAQRRAVKNPNRHLNNMVRLETAQWPDSKVMPAVTILNSWKSKTAYGCHFAVFVVPVFSAACDCIRAWDNCSGSRGRTCWRHAPFTSYVRHQAWVSGTQCQEYRCSLLQCRSHTGVIATSLTSNDSGILSSIHTGCVRCHAALPHVDALRCTAALRWAEPVWMNLYTTTTTRPQRQQEPHTHTHTHTERLRDGAWSLFELIDVAPRVVDVLLAYCVHQKARKHDVHHLSQTTSVPPTDVTYLAPVFPQQIERTI